MRHTTYLSPAASKALAAGKAHATTNANVALALVVQFAVFILAALSVNPASASTRPHEGGTLRVQMTGHIPSVDPRQWPSNAVSVATAEKLDSLVFDRLTRFDDRGVLQPDLAISWNYDELSKRWQFHLRTGVTFTDGSTLTPVEAALALQQLLGNSFDVSAAGDSVFIYADSEVKNLPALLATGRYFIFHLASDGSILGTGPFRISEWRTASSLSRDLSIKVTMVAADSCWAGRPFVDRLEITMGVSPQEQASAIAFGKADLVELSAPQVREETQRGLRTQSSEPMDLLALQFDTSWPAVRDPVMRGAIAKIVDRASIAEAILQKQAIPAGGLLPGRISGYAHLFPIAVDPAGAMQTLSSPERKVSRATPLTLVYDLEDADARAVCERVVVNLRAAGIAAQAIAAAAANTPAEIRLVRIHLDAPDAGIALANALSSLGEPATALDTPEEQFAAERAPIDAFRVISLVHVSESVGLGTQVRDWLPSPWGGWRLDEVWLAKDGAAGAGQ